MSLTFETLRRDRPEIANLLELTLKAGAAIMEVYQAGCEVENKTDGSPVTVADQAAEDIIQAGLTAQFPEIPLVAEEAVEAGHLPICGKRYFLVDPLDGTREFIKRNGEFTVNIALIDGGVPVFGVVFAPALGEIYWGGAVPSESPSAGTFFAKVENGTLTSITPISVRPADKGNLTLLASRSHMCEATEAFIGKLNISERTCVGSSLKLCWLAAGKADVYPRLGPTMQWDIAAGDAVLRAAGGKVVRQATASPLLYQVPEKASKSDLINSEFIAVGDPGILNQLT